MTGKWNTYARRNERGPHSAPTPRLTLRQGTLRINRAALDKLNLKTGDSVLIEYLDDGTEKYISLTKQGGHRQADEAIKLPGRRKNDQSITIGTLGLSAALGMSEKAHRFVINDDEIFESRVYN